MTKFMLVVFTALTLGAAWLTYHDTGVKEPNIDSVREGSTGHGLRGTGRGHYGK